MKYYAVLVTGGPDYFLTPCVIIKASDEESAKAELKKHNRDYRRYSIALDRITTDELPEYIKQGAHIAETSEDIADAF